MIKIKMPTHRYRVMHQLNKQYEGDNLDDAITVFRTVTAKRGTTFHPGTHTVTDEPLVQALAPDGSLVACLYGATLDEWEAKRRA